MGIFRTHLKIKRYEDNILRRSKQPRYGLRRKTGHCRIGTDRKRNAGTERLRRSRHSARLHKVGVHILKRSAPVPRTRQGGNVQGQQDNDKRPVRRHPPGVRRDRIHTTV